jgi:hypothetical protein
MAHKDCLKSFLGTLFSFNSIRIFRGGLRIIMTNFDFLVRRFMISLYFVAKLGMKWLKIEIKGFSESLFTRICLSHPCFCRSGPEIKIK